MSVTAVVGAQWGDEGKGRVVDYLAADADLVIRYGGGNNAGHTVVNPHGHFKLHLIPSGIFSSGTRNLLGNGVVINPPALVTELDGLDAAGIGYDNLLISDRAHLVMPYHVLLDRLEERERGAGKLGTTSRGIGPAYVDKVARRGIRVIDLMEPSAFRERLDAALPRIHRIVAGYPGGDPELDALVAEATDPERVAEAYLVAGERLRPHVVDGLAVVDEALERGDRILLEGQLGTMRDIDWGTYPFVTSSSPIPGGASLGAGMPAVRIDRVLGVAKAYVTAVGGGPLPTELTGPDGDDLRERGAEYGTSTGRPRRCGWYDAVAVRFSVRLAGYSSLALTKLDVLDGYSSHPAGACLPRPCRRARVGDRAGVDIGLSAAGAGLRGAAGLADRYDRGPLVGRAARAGPCLRRAARGAGGRADQPCQRRTRARPDDREE